MVNKNQNNVDFGYKSVKKSDKQKLVNNIFNSVARKYDLMNDITSLGIHRNWKSDLINWIAPQSNQNLADIAGGTGDIAYKFLNAGGNSAHIFDINKEMIQVSKQKYRNIKNLEWSIASAENIPALDNSFERANQLFNNTKINSERIENSIRTYSDNWSYERIGKVELITLTLGISELIMDLSPTKVIISEWVKLADKHSSSQSAKFVNGILDKLSQEI